MATLTVSFCKMGARAAAFAGLFIATASHASEWISHISPNGAFAVHASGPGSFESAELVALPSRREVVGLAAWEGTLTWSPDSRRFARTVDEGPRVSSVAIQQRAGKSFETITIIRDFPGPATTGGWPKEWRETGRGTQYLHPIRWIDADTLLMSVSQSVFLRKGEEREDWRVEAQFSVKLGRNGKRTTSPLSIVYRGLGDVKKTPPKLVSDHVAEPEDWQISPDRSVALVEAAGVLDVIEQRKGEPARVTHLRTRIEELFLADFRDCGAEPLSAETPFALNDDSVRLAGAHWVLQGGERVAIHCEATTNPNGDQRSKMWCARLDAVWSIKEAKFIERRIVRGFCGTLGEAANTRVAARSASGTFRIEVREQLDERMRTTGDFNVFVVPDSAEGGAPEPLDQRLSAEQAPSATYLISPDGRWIYAKWGSSQGSLLTFFARGEGLRFAKIFPSDPETGNDGFEKAMWDFCRKTAGLESPSSSRTCTFIAWAPDSSRVLVSLRVDMKGVNREWKVYWNTRTRAFELTPYLEQLNERAYDVPMDTTESRLRPYCAEPVDPLPSLEELDRKIGVERKAFEEDWTGTAAHEKERVAKDPPGDWPPIEKKAEAWRVEAIGDIEKFAAEFSRRWPEAEREQWRRLSLAGGFRVLHERISAEWPWGP